MQLLWCLWFQSVVTVYGLLRYCYAFAKMFCSECGYVVARVLQYNN